MRRPVNTRVGDTYFPVEQMLVLLLQAREHPALEHIIFYIIYTFFDLSLIPWRIKSGGQNHGAVMFAKGLDLGVDVRIVSVGILYCGFQIVDDQSPGHATKVPEGILQTANEVVSGLTIDNFTVRFARETQNDPKDSRFLLFLPNRG